MWMLVGASMAGGKRASPIETLWPDRIKGCYTLRWCNTGVEDISLLIIIGCAMSINAVTQAQL